MTIEQLRIQNVSKEAVPEIESEEPQRKQRWKDKLFTIKKKINREKTSSSLQIQDDNDDDGEDDENFDWWTKYYASIDVLIFVSTRNYFYIKHF